MVGGVKYTRELHEVLMLYMTKIPSRKGIEMIKREKEKTKTWPEHYQYLVYVEERSEKSVQECLC